MNMASRMESNSEPNRVNLSAAAHAALKAALPGARTSQRGAVEIKGKGKLECYWLDLDDVALEILRPPPSSTRRSTPDEPPSPARSMSVPDGCAFSTTGEPSALGPGWFSHLPAFAETARVGDGPADQSAVPGPAPAVLEPGFRPLHTVLEEKDAKLSPRSDVTAVTSQL